MNRAQKNALFGFGFSLIASILILFIGAISISRVFQTFPWIFSFTGAAALIFGALLFCSLFFRKKKGGNIIDADERDRQISGLAIKISFTSIWLLLLIADFLTVYFVGIIGSVPPILFIIIHLSVFIFSATIYFLSILIIYQVQGGTA